MSWLIPEAGARTPRDWEPLGILRDQVRRVPAHAMVQLGMDLLMEVRKRREDRLELVPELICSKATEQRPYGGT